MNLRTKFILLVIGVTILPPLLIAVTFMVPARLAGEGGSPNGMVFIQKALQHILPEYLKTGITRGFDELGKRGISTLLIENGLPVYGKDDFEPFTRGTGGRDAVGEMIVTDPGHVYLAYPYVREGKDGLLVLRERVYTGEGGGVFKFGFTIFPVSILLVASFISLLIIRSINRSIKTLESATREIASGNLDFALAPQGNDAFSSLTRSYNIMREQLKEELARRSRFILGVSHDLKTPLALIEGYADAILDGHANSDEELYNYLGIIKEKSVLLEQRIIQLIEFVNMETGEWKFHLKKVNLSEFITSLAEIYKDESAILGYDFNYEIDIPEDIFVDMDEDLVRRVFDNLLQNAVRYSNEGEQRAGLTAKAEQ